MGSIRTSGKVEKARAPYGSKVQPTRFNTTAADATPSVGGFQDARADRSRAMGRVARKGRADGAASTARPTTGDPEVVPGRPGPAKPNPAAPRSLAQNRIATGQTSTSGESTGRSMSRMARNGGMKPLNPARHRGAAFPRTATAFRDQPSDSTPTTNQPLRGSASGSWS